MKTWRKKTGKKKDQFTKPDEFQSLTQKVMTFAQENTQKVYIGLAVLGVVIIAAIIVTLLMQSSHRRVTAKEAEALKYYDINSPVPGTKPMGAAERLKKARELFGEVADSEATALYYKANSNMELGELDQAIADYMKLKESTKDPVLTSLANMRLAEAYLAKGDAQKAAASYMDNIKAEKGLMKDMAHFKLAGIFLRLGEKDRAVQEYRVISKDFPNSPFAAEAKMNADRLEGVAPQAAAGQATPASGMTQSKVVTIPMAKAPAAPKEKKDQPK